MFRENQNKYCATEVEEFKFNEHHYQVGKKMEAQNNLFMQKYLSRQSVSSEDSQEDANAQALNIIVESSAGQRRSYQPKPIPSSGIVLDKVPQQIVPVTTPKMNRKFTMGEFSLPQPLDLLSHASTHIGLKSSRNQRNRLSRHSTGRNRYR